MVYQQKVGGFARFRQRAVAVIRTEGFVGLAERVVERLRPRHYGSYIVALSLNHLLHVPIPAVDVQIRQIRATDGDGLQALVEADEWGKSKVQMLELLAEGHLCYVATCRGQIVSSHWWVPNGEYHDHELHRKLKLAASEVFTHSVFTVPAFRGKGIDPFLREQVFRDIACTQGKTRALARVVASNRAALRGWAKAGGKRVGRVGFVELLGVRFHYLLGRGIFGKSTRRFYVERIVPT